MGGNFNINPNFKIEGFNNSINDFNKIFSNSFEKNYNNALNFDEVLSDVISQNDAQNFKIGAQYYVGADAINSQKVENLSSTAKLAQDLGAGFKNSINELNSIDKKAEQDFETFASGGDISVHDVMISAQKSNLAMQMAIQLRNQMLNAYNEFKNMSI